MIDKFANLFFAMMFTLIPILLAFVIYGLVFCWNNPLDVRCSRRINIDTKFELNK